MPCVAVIWHQMVLGWVIYPPYRVSILTKSIIRRVFTHVCIQLVIIGSFECPLYSWSITTTAQFPRRSFDICILLYSKRSPFRSFFVSKNINYPFCTVSECSLDQIALLGLINWVALFFHDSEGLIKTSVIDILKLFMPQDIKNSFRGGLHDLGKYDLSESPSFELFDKASCFVIRLGDRLVLCRGWLPHALQV